MVTYQTLDLEVADYQVARGRERMSVRVARSPAGEQRAGESVALSPDVRDRLQALEAGDLRLQELIDLGETLGGLLFPPAARALLERSLSRLADEDVLRIRLMLRDDAPARLPWEYAYVARADTPADQKGPEGFLALDRRVSLVRYEVLGQEPGRLDPVGEGRLRLVALLASPDDPRYARLRLEDEAAFIRAAVEDLPEIEPAIHTGATVRTLQDAITPGLHIFHFAGHGEFPDEGTRGADGNPAGRGAIVLCDEDGRAREFPAEQLAWNLRGRGVRLAVLGACESGRRGLNPWTGVATALTRAGIPAVVAMQYPIADENAIEFSRRFYRVLAAGQAIDAAVTDGRLAVADACGAGNPDWGVPVLYLRADDGVLFPRVRFTAAGSGSAAGGRAAGPADVNLTALRRAIAGHFTLEEIAILCEDVEQALRDAGYDIAVDPEAVGGRSREGIALNLIRYLEHRGVLRYLVDAVRRERPGSL
jgi:hypothetical protein